MKPVKNENITEQKKDELKQEKESTSNMHIVQKNKQTDALFTGFFLQDLRKTGIAVIILLSIEGLIYYALSTNAFSVNSYLPF